MSFRGFPEEQRAFFEAVAEDTTWENVSARAEQHLRAIYSPMREPLTQSLSGRVGCSVG
jgi:hypothetical protein